MGLFAGCKEAAERAKIPHKGLRSDDPVDLVGGLGASAEAAIFDPGATAIAWASALGARRW